MSMNISVLRAELADDPEGYDYDFMSDQEAAAQLNACNRPVPDPTRKSFRDLLRSVGVVMAGTLYEKIKSATVLNPALTLAVEALGDYGANGGLDFSCESTLSAIQELVTSEIITEDEAELLRALGKKIISRAEELGLGHVRGGHVERARKV